MATADTDVETTTANKLRAQAKMNLLEKVKANPIESTVIGGLILFVLTEFLKPKTAVATTTTTTPSGALGSGNLGSAGGGGSVNIGGTPTSIIAPPAPTGVVNVLNATTAGVSFDWSSIANQYDLTQLTGWELNVDGVVINVSGANTTNYTLSQSFNANTTHVVSLAACNYYTCSDFGTSQQFTVTTSTTTTSTSTPTTVPQTPQPPTLTNVTQTSFTVDETTNPSTDQVTSYNLAILTQGSTDIIPVTQFPYQVTGLYGGQYYQVLVQAVNSVGASGWSMNTDVTTAKPISSIVITPSSINLNVGSSQQLSITAQFADGTSQDITNQANLSSSSSSIASVSSNGLVTGVGAGSTTITASYGGKSGSANVTVAAVQPVVQPTVQPVTTTTANIIKAAATYSPPVIASALQTIYPGLSTNTAIKAANTGINTANQINEAVIAAGGGGQGPTVLSANIAAQAIKAANPTGYTSNTHAQSVLNSIVNTIQTSNASQVSYSNHNGVTYASGGGYGSYSGPAVGQPGGPQQATNMPAGFVSAATAQSLFGIEV